MVVVHGDRRVQSQIIQPVLTDEVALGQAQLHSVKAVDGADGLIVGGGIFHPFVVGDELFIVVRHILRHEIGEIQQNAVPYTGSHAAVIIGGSAGEDIIAAAGGNHQVKLRGGTFHGAGNILLGHAGISSAIAIRTT